MPKYMAQYGTIYAEEKGIEEQIIPKHAKISGTIWHNTAQPMCPKKPGNQEHPLSLKKNVLQGFCGFRMFS